MNSKIVRGLLVVLLGAAIWFCPAPAGMKPQAWHLFAIFVATIAGFIAPTAADWRRGVD